MDAAQIAALLSALGAGTVLAEAIRGLRAWLTGRAGRERGRNADLVQQRDDAYRRAQEAEERADEAARETDREARARRIAQEYASTLRRLLAEAGITPPPWP